MDGRQLNSVFVSACQLMDLQSWGYALFVELPDLDTFIVNHLNNFPEWKVCIVSLQQFDFHIWFRSISIESLCGHMYVRTLSL